MKVLLINGSPHKDGCTQRALDEVAKALVSDGIEVEHFWLTNKAVAGCMACGYCRRHGTCVHHDVVDEFAEKAQGADGFIFGTPVHYANASGALTSFMDRLFYAYSPILRYKPAAVIASARRAGTSSTLDQINKYFTINQMPVVSSKYWNMVHGNCKEEVEEDQEGLQIMRYLGYNMAFLLKCIEAGKEKGLKVTTEEKIVHTNFIRHD